MERYMYIKVDNPPGSHVMCVYKTRDSLVRHGLHYLKEGLDGNESCLLITHYLSKNKVKDVMAELWRPRYMSGLKWNGDLKIVPAFRVVFQRPAIFIQSRFCY